MADWVIVVDDDEKNLMVAGRILNAAHMRVTAIKSGAALLAFLKEREIPDLILLDIKMPDMDGFETLSELRKLPKAITKEPIISIASRKTIYYLLSPICTDSKPYVKTLHTLSLFLQALLSSTAFQTL